MPFHVVWHTTNFVVLLILFVNVLSQTILGGTTTTDSSPSKPRTWHHCPDPPMLANGYHLSDKSSQGSLIVNYYCNPKYELVGPSRFKCSIVIGELPDKPPSDWRDLFTSSWNPSFSGTSCKRRDDTDPALYLKCTLPRKPTNSHLNLRDWRYEYPYESGVMYTCDKGYRLIGSPVRWCKPGGKWYPEVEPECVDEDHFTTTEPAPPMDPDENERFTIMTIILYISIPLLVIFALAIVCNLRKRFFKHNRRALEHSSGTPDREDTHPQLLPPRATGYTTGYLYSPNTAPTAPVANTDDFTILETLLEDDPVPIRQEPPSYEEATRDSSLPSFEVAQKLHNSSLQIS